MRRLAILVFFILLSCSKDSPVPDAVVPTPTLTFTLAVTASEGGSVNDPGDAHNENANVSLTATPADGYVFSGWSGDASGSTNPLIITMTGDKNITASFIRLQYSLSVNIIGSGTVSQVLVESSEKNTDYDPFSTVRLTALPVSNWIFYGWSGSTTETTNEVDIVMEETKSVTATFEEKLSQIIGVDDVFFGNGKWKIRKPKGGGSSSNTIDESSKQMLANCALSEIIFRTDGSFTIISGTTTTTGQFSVDSNTTISLTQAQSPFGTITNLVLTNNFISFSIQLIDGCSEEANGEKDDTYVESEDTYIPPVISLVGSSTIYIGVGDNFTDPGATASDYIDGDLTSSITSSGTVNTATEGTYLITYTVSDAAGNSVSITRTVIVSLDLPPTITLTGSSTITLLVGDTYIEDGCVATDVVDGDLTSSIITTGTVDTSTEGTYTLVYSVTDSASNIVSTTRTVIVSAATNSANCTISGQNIGGGQSQTVTLTNAISDITFAVTSSCQENLQEEVLGLPTGVTMNFSDNTAIISGTPTGQTGDYSYVVNWYSATSSFTLGGTITVVAGSTTSTSTTSSSTADTTPPVISLLGSSTINLTVGDTFTDPGATATDDVDGDITSSITINGYVLPITQSYSSEVDTSTAGTYTISFYVSDASGNAATVVQRTVIVSIASSISFDSNGTCNCAGATVGDTAVIDGVTYTAVDDNSIAGEIANENYNLCTTLVTSMSNLFKDNTSFNSNIDFWDTSNVTALTDMFNGANSFNRDVSGWDLSSALNLSYMFFNASSFNQNISSWDISTVIYIDNLFNGATAFSQDLDSWDTSNILGMSGVFANGNFNGDISNWDTSSVTNMESMLSYNSSFNQDISSWNTSSVTAMDDMFRNNPSFNQNISGWNVGSVTSMERMFLEATVFNQDLTGWCVSSITSEPDWFFGTLHPHLRSFK